ncbi:thiamine phosphate synthase [Mucilaginibacter lappiensis]|uniref:Thiamine-phosphate pyrophosphorylase n=1 Tax=Mucilaginibacter lappiensis TaxID=354630 RepID=A0A841JGU3_9SPHI|nr:thiamine phosphate synthase [Mucilaginibacter lappiensis]MBB6127858.1 thiamine-phosphate pyrophosphorylase [Mucilaginibacter lappiensis]
MQLIVISHPDSVVNEAQVINQLFDAGLTRFHLRKPDWSDEQLVDLLRQIDQAFYPYIALHQHHHIAIDFNIKRLHYTEKHRLATEPGKLIIQKEEGYVLSTSIHDITELNSLIPFDYTFFGPVFNSISKPGYQSNLTEDFNINQNDNQPRVIALGGVEYSNLDKLKLMGFDGAAILGTIWNDPTQAITNFRKLQEYLLTKQT